jgi:hypothetical protein
LPPPPHPLPAVRAPHAPPPLPPRDRYKYCQAQDNGVVYCNRYVDVTKSLPVLVVVANKFINATCQERGYDDGSARCAQHLLFNQAFQAQAQAWASNLSAPVWNNGDYW